MENSEKLKYIKSFLKKVAKQRSFLIRKGKSKLPPEYSKTEIRNIEYALTRLNNFEIAAQYIRRKEQDIRYLIPANFKTWANEFDNLLMMQ